MMPINPTRSAEKQLLYVVITPSTPTLNNDNGDGDGRFVAAEVADTVTSSVERAFESKALMVMAMMTSQTRRTVAVRNRATRKPLPSGSISVSLRAMTWD